jgi:hypothetical protein
VFTAIEGLTGVIASEARFAALIASEVLPLTDPDVALIVTVPRFRPVASPLTVIEARLLPEDAHVTVPVMSCVVLSENVPTALYCCNTPSGIEEFKGVTSILVSVALVTVSVAVPVTVPEGIVKLAVIVDIPPAKPIAFPLVGTVSLIDAALVFDEVHVTLLVMFCVLPSA